MNFSGRLLGSMIVLFSSLHGGLALTADNPYHTILDRNPFGLNPPAPIATNSTVTPPRNVKLNGVTKIGGRVKAFFTILGAEPKDPPQYVSLSETERTEVLEVMKISKDGEVEVINSGVKMVLNFKNNGNKAEAPTAIAAAAPPVGQIAPITRSVIYNATDPTVAAVSPNPVSQRNDVVFNGSNPAMNSASVVLPTGRLSGRSSAQHELDVDPVAQRMNMVANHMVATSAYEGGQTVPVHGPTDPKVHSSTGPVTRRLPLPPPPPIPPSPPSLSALTGE